MAESVPPEDNDGLYRVPFPFFTTRIACFGDLPVMPQTRSAECVTVAYLTPMRIVPLLNSQVSSARPRSSRIRLPAVLCCCGRTYGIRFGLSSGCFWRVSVSPLETRTA